MTDSDVAWYENDNGFTRNTIASIQATDPFADVAVGDLDGDGDLDVVVVGDNVWICTNDGSNGFTNAVKFGGTP